MHYQNLTGGGTTLKVKLTIKADFTNHETSSIELWFAEKTDAITLNKINMTTTIETYPNAFFNITSDDYLEEDTVTSVFDTYNLALDYINEKWGYTLIYPSITPSEDYTLELYFH